MPVRTVREHQALYLEPMDALVAGVHDVLVHARAAYGPKLAVDEADEVADWEAVVDECLRKGLEVRRPRGERAVVGQVGERIQHVLHLRRGHTQA